MKIPAPALKMTGKMLFKAFSVMIVVFLNGCRKDLCYDHDHWKVRVLTDWELAWERDYGRDWADAWTAPAGYSYASLQPDPGTGLGAMVYKPDGRVTERHIKTYGDVLPVGEGRHSILFYNDDTEYILFSSMDSWAEASATTRTRTRSTYSQNHSRESTVNSPDMLFGSWLEALTVAGSPDATPADLPVTMRPLVYKYLIVYRFDKGIEYVKQARGAMAGMARSVFLRDGRTGPEKVTVLFDEARIDTKRSEVSVIVNTFGVPDYPDKYYQGRQTRNEHDVFGLNLEVMLPDGSMKTFEFDISSQMADQPRGGVITVGGLTVDKGEFGQGGMFDVTVDGWGDYEDIILPV